MDADSFNALALRVISREATDDERRSLEAELASVPARRADFEQMQVTHDVLRATAPMAEAVGATAPELPAHRRGELRTAVRQQFGPEAKTKAEGSTVWAHLLRWVFGGGGLAALGFAIAMFCFANRTIEVGLYGTDLVRGEQGLSAQDVPAAKLIAFDQDAPFDAWQNAPLAWNERAKIWVDNERDLLYIVERGRHGHVVMVTRPLAATDAEQKEQIKQVVESLAR
jgi:hypothetical protein